MTVFYNPCETKEGITQVPLVLIHSSTQSSVNSNNLSKGLTTWFPLRPKVLLPGNQAFPWA